MTRPRIQTDHLNRLKWGIAFCQEDLSQHREGDWMNLSHDLDLFCQHLSETSEKALGWDAGKQRWVKKFVGREEGVPWKPLHTLPNRRKTARDVQNLLRGALRGIAIAKDGFLSVWPIKTSQLTLSVGSPSQSFYSSLKAPDRKNGAILALFEHLAGSGITLVQIRLCPECHKISLIDRKPRTDRTFHCSLRCARAAATRRYRKKKKNDLRKKDRERKHHHYVKMQQQKYGPNVRVVGRPRNTDESATKG